MRTFMDKPGDVSFVSYVLLPQVCLCCIISLHWVTSTVDNKSRTTLGGEGCRHVSLLIIPLLSATSGFFLTELFKKNIIELRESLNNKDSVFWPKIPPCDYLLGLTGCVHRSCRNGDGRPEVNYQCDDERQQHNSSLHLLPVNQWPSCW